MSKGSGRRPASVTEAEIAANYERIFGKAVRVEWEGEAPSPDGPVAEFTAGETHRMTIEEACNLGRSPEGE